MNLLVSSSGSLVYEISREGEKVIVRCVRFEVYDGERADMGFFNPESPEANKIADLVAEAYPHNGAWSIAQERRRQIEKKGFTDEHDDDHTTGELAQAAECYVSVAGAQAKGISAIGDPGPVWPWFRRDWKPSEDPIRNLEKAGALIAAEIDRLRRLAERETKS